LNELETHNIDEYVALAGRLGRDPERRKDISQKISQFIHLVYRDTACIRGLEQFLKEVVH